MLPKRKFSSCFCLKERERERERERLLVQNMRLNMGQRRFLEVDCWNEMHGIDITDNVEEDLVQEMKTIQVWWCVVRAHKHTRTHL
jgi:hypothetical protein